jgi:hypothetical protein
MNEILCPENGCHVWFSTTAELVKHLVDRTMDRGVATTPMTQTTLAVSAKSEERRVCVLCPAEFPMRYGNTRRRSQ